VIRLQVAVKPNARESALERCEDGSYRAWIKSPPVDGKANEELIALIANAFHVPRSRVRIRSGAGGRRKLVEIDE
jgi:uncharacterized protein (TIGR00251 family)